MEKSVDTDITHVRRDSEDSAQQDQQSTVDSRMGAPPVVHKTVVKQARSAPTALEESEAIRSKIAELELVMGSADVEKRDAAKIRRKTLLKVEKIVQSKTQTAEEKLSLLHVHFASVVTEQGKLEDELISMKRKTSIVTRERDQAQNELSKRRVLTDKLQELCRELQKENKRVSEERAAQAESEVSRTKQMLQNFEDSLRDLTARLDIQSKEGADRANENESLRKAYQALNDKFQLQQECFDHQVKAKDVELQIAALKMEQEQAIKRELLERVQAAHLSRGELETSKEELQAQLAMYNSKFEELSLSITSTSGAFADLKRDIALKSDIIKKLQKLRKNQERENQELRVRCERSNASLAELMDELAAAQKGKADSDEHQKLKGQVKVLTDLCRALQQQLKERPSVTDAFQGITLQPGSEGSVPSTATPGVDSTVAAGGAAPAVLLSESLDAPADESAEE